MALATLKEVLKIASETKTAIPGFNIDNIEIPEAIMTAAEAYHCPETLDRLLIADAVIQVHNHRNRCAVRKAAHHIRQM